MPPVTGGIVGPLDVAPALDVPPALPLPEPLAPPLPELVPGVHFLQETWHESASQDWLHQLYSTACAQVSPLFGGLSVQATGAPPEETALPAAPGAPDAPPESVLSAPATARLPAEPATAGAPDADTLGPPETIGPVLGPAAPPPAPSGASPVEPLKHEGKLSATSAQTESSTPPRSRR